MKNKLNKILLLNCLIGTIFVSCNSEDNYLKEKNYQENLNLQLRKVTLKDVESNLKVYEKLTIPKARFKNVGNTNKTINDSINNFSIDSNLGIYIQNGDYHSYTFKINRPNGSTFLLENVVVSKMPNNEYETILYQYNINEYELEQIQNREYIDLTGKINKVLLENSNIADEITGKYYFNGSCWEDYSYYQPEQRCTEGGNHPFSRCSQCVGCGTSSGPQPGGMISGSTVVPCDDDSGAPFIPDQNNPSPGNSYHGANVNTNLSTPVDLCPTCPLFDGNETTPPCNQLKKLTDTKSIQSALAYLKKNKLDKPSEFGYSVSTFSGSSGIATPSVIQSAPRNPHGIKLPSGGNIIGALHVHVLTGCLMFSHEDFRALAVIANNNNNDLDCSTFFVTLTTNDGTFAIMIDDFATFFDAMKGLKYLDFHKDIEKEYKKEGLPSTSINYQKILLKAMSKHNIGASLYKANPDLSGWSKLSLDPANPDNNPIPTPCE